jgi:hypothetical protein
MARGKRLNDSRVDPSKNPRMKRLALLLLALSALQACGFTQSATPAASPAPPEPTTAETSLPPSSPSSKVAEDEWKARREATLNAKWNVCVDVQMVMTEEAKALELIPDLQSDDERKVESAWAKLQEMIKAKEATLLGWPMVRAVDGDRAVSETILEKRYPTEFEPPQEPQTFGPPSAPPHLDPNKPVVENGLPTAFETRNIGVTLEVEAHVLGDGKRIHLDLVPQRVELLEMGKNESVLTKRNVIVQVRQPLFSTTKTTENVTLKNGQRLLIGVHKLAKPAGQIEFHIVHAVAAEAE